MMSVVMNEREWAEAAIASRSLGKIPSETLSRVARYYFHHKGFTKRTLLCRKIEEFLLTCDTGTSLAKWEKMVERVAKNAPSHPLIEVHYVDITEDEMRVIQSLNGIQLQRLAFTLLCTAKFWNMCKDTNSGWVNLKDQEISAMSNFGGSTARRSELLRTLRDIGVIRFSKKVDNLNIQVRFIMEESPVVMRVCDMRNLGYQFSAYCGGEYIQCAQCGVTVPRKHNAHKYCDDCAPKVHVKQYVERVTLPKN